MGEWSPSLPSGLARDTPLDTEPSASGLPWQSAPGTSHVHSFRFYDARKYSFLRKFGDEAVKGQSQLQVRFKHPKSGAVQSEFWYFFPDHNAGLAVYDEMKAAAQPGTVVNERLVKAGVPYRRQL